MKKTSNYSNNRSMRLDKYNYKSKDLYTKHFVFWVIYLGYGCFTDRILYPNFAIEKDIILFFTHNIFLFYSFLFCLKMGSKNSRNAKFLSLFLILLVIIFFILLRLWLNFKVYPAIDRSMNIPLEHLDVRVIIIGGSLWVLSYFLLALGYFYFTQSILKERQLRLIQEESQIQAIKYMRLKEEKSRAKQERLQNEKEKIQLENTLLRAQINPHFLFNTLGYFYNEISDLHPQVGEGIAALACIMRSAIRKPDKDGLIPLDEEIDNIEQLVSIYKLRYSDSVHIDFVQQGDSKGGRILPHILTTFVENGLKHGELHNADHPLSIRLSVMENGMNFVLNNKKRLGPKELSHGIGMAYIRKCMDAFYKDDYTLSVEEDAVYYAVSIQIPLSVKRTNLIE